MIVRTASTTDAAAIAAIYAPIVRDTAISFETEPPDADGMAARIETTLATHPWLVAEADEAIAGYAYAGLHAAREAYRWSANTTVYVAENRRGSGVGRALYAALIGILRRQGFHSAFAGITLPNAASIALHEAMGFEPLGIYREVGFKLGRWRDVGWWRLGLSAADGGPREPVPFPALTQSKKGRAGAVLAPARATI